MYTKQKNAKTESGQSVFIIIIIIIKKIETHVKFK